jgi:hypothetical protein
MNLIPLSAVPSQKLSVLLGGQNCQIKVYQKTTGLYVDLSVNNAPIVSGVICRNAVQIVRDVYLGFSGDLVFLDTQGSDDPDYTGLAGRFQFVYLAADEVPS